MSHLRVPGVRIIVLVGFMAAGKTTVGRRLAARLGWEFVDLDEMITTRSGRTPAALIREEGVAAFRELEAEATAALAGREELVLAPGGGWVTRPELAERLGPHAVRVWLRISPETAVRRAAAEATAVDRPLLEGPGAPVERAGALLAEREPLYRAAELHVDAEADPDDIVDEIANMIRTLTPGS